MKCDDAVLFNAQRYSIHNMGKLIEDKKCGCFYCGSIFDPMEISEWTDADTALCPYCGIDAILGESPLQVSHSEFLLKIYLGVRENAPGCLLHSPF